MVSPLRREEGLVSVGAIFVAKNWGGGNDCCYMGWGIGKGAPTVLMGLSYKISHPNENGVSLILYVVRQKPLAER
jgi:hypothetical protein